MAIRSRSCYLSTLTGIPDHLDVTTQPTADGRVQCTDTALTGTLLTVARDLHKSQLKFFGMLLWLRVCYRSWPWSPVEYGSHS